MAFSKRLAMKISFAASLIQFFIIIVFQLPLFRVPCRIGICKTPIELTCSQLIATKVFPTFVKAVMYPGAIVKGLIKNGALPSFNEVFDLYDFNIFRGDSTASSFLRKTYASSDLLHLELLAGSYLSVAGAILGLLRPGRMSMLGSLLIIWSSMIEGFQRREMGSSKTIQIYPTMVLPVLLGLLSQRRDLRRLFRSCRHCRLIKSLRSKLKHV